MRPAEIINYTISVDNTGNVDLTNPVVTDAFADAGSLTFVGGDDGDGVLETTETWQYTATHTVTQAEMNAGDDLVNVAVADTDQTDPEDDDATTTVDQNPDLTIVKDADKSSVNAAGQIINYTISVDNSGNVDLTNPVVTDAFADAGSLTFVGGDDGDGVLETTETWQYTATHTVTQAEMNAGDDLVNVAVADTDQTDPEDDDATTTVDQNPDLTIIKDAVVADGHADHAGDIIHYTIRSTTPATST